MYPKLGKIPLLISSLIASITVLGFFIIIIFSVVLLIFGFTQTRVPENVAKQQLEFIKNNDYESAYDLFTDDAKSTNSIDTFKTKFAAYTNQRDAHVNFQKQKMVNDKTKLNGIISINGLEQPITYHLIQIGENWKIQSVDFQKL